MKRKIAALLCSCILAACMSFSAGAQEENVFGDVKTTDWFYKYAKFAYDQGIITGKGTTADGKVKFDPSNNMTRAEFVQVLYSKEGKPSVEYKDVFADVKEKDWFAKAVLWANERDIVKGTGDTFNVSGNITRQEMAAILYKYAVYKGYDVSEKAELSEFVDDETVASWAIPGMQWAVKYGVISGKNANGGLELAPNGAAIRAEAATMVRSFMVEYKEVTEDKYVPLDPSAEGEISIMMWSGDGQYYEDIGHKTLEPVDITSQNVAGVYAMAKKFNETYPNVKINLYAKSGDYNSNEITWEQELENFKEQHGKYPDVWASPNLIDDVEKGLCADLSVFADDPVYQSFNPAIIEMMNYYGVQAGLPQFIQPWGVFVNTELAEQNNIDVPDPDWTIDDYTEFISQGDKETFWGAMDIPLSWINTGTQDINYSLANHKTGDATYVNLESDAVKSLLELVPAWADNTIWTQNDIGKVPSQIMDDGWWWSYHFFTRQYCLTNDGDPWMMGDAANAEITDSTCTFEFDIYPRPATDYCDNTVGVVLDPMAVHNYAMDDGDPALSETEEQQLKLAYTFGTYWCASTEAMQARADQQWNSGGEFKIALNDSLPIVIGEEFDKQMEIWYSAPIHALYEEKPGWNAVLEIWESGRMWDVADKTYPLIVLEDGVEKACMYEWTYHYTDEVMTTKRAEDGWLDEIKSKLPEWNKKANERFAQAEVSLKNALVAFYGYTDADFE